MKTPPVRLHLTTSLTKGGIRIFSTTLSLYTHTWISLVVGILIVECLRIVEEFF